LAVDHLGYSLANPRRKLGLLDGLASQAGPNEGPYTLRTGDAADVGGEDAIGAGLHPLLPALVKACIACGDGDARTARHAAAGARRTVPAKAYVTRMAAAILGKKGDGVWLAHVLR
jgi:hypothetical protein